MNYTQPKNNRLESYWYLTNTIDLKFGLIAESLDKFNEKLIELSSDALRIDSNEERVRCEKIKNEILNKLYLFHDKEFIEYSKPSDRTFEIVRYIINHTVIENYKFFLEFFITPYGTIELIFESEDNRLMSIEIGKDESRYYVEVSNADTLYVNFNNDDIEEYLIKLNKDLSYLN